jgi:hypothetical protein
MHTPLAQRVINCRDGYRPGAAARLLITDTKVDSRRGRDGPIADIGDIQGGPRVL